MAAPPFREALITGASSGLGRAIAVELGRRGAYVHLLARREDELERAREEIRAAGAPKTGGPREYCHPTGDGGSSGAARPS